MPPIHQQDPICIRFIKISIQTIGSVLYLSQLGLYNATVWDFNNNDGSKVDFDTAYVKKIIEFKHTFI